jgi:hypothetical protein
MSRVVIVEVAHGAGPVMTCNAVINSEDFIFFTALLFGIRLEEQ